MESEYDDPPLRGRPKAGSYSVWEAIRFGLVGLASLAVYQTGFILLDKLGCNHTLAAAGGYLASAVVHFSAHRYITFKRARHAPVYGQLLRYLCSVVVNFAIIAASLNLLLWAGVTKYYASLLAMGVSLGSSYLFQKYFVYRS